MKKSQEKKSNSGNWVKTLLESMGSKKSKAHTMIHPCIIGDKQSLVHEKGLKDKDPVSYKLLNEYANQNNFQVVEDRRDNFIDGIRRVKNSRRANAISLMVVAAGLFSPTAQGATDEHGTGPHVDADSNISHENVEAGYALNLDATQSHEELVHELLGWINNHSKFNYDISNLPEIKTVSKVEIAEIAFGGKLPASLDAEKLNLMGLYNFNNDSIYLLDSVDLSTDDGRGILLHELVHFMQYHTGLDKDISCVSELESLAYALEAKFLESHHHKHNITQGHIDKVSQCRT